MIPPQKIALVLTTTVTIIVRSNHWIKICFKQNSINIPLIRTFYYSIVNEVSIFVGFLRRTNDNSISGKSQTKKPSSPLVYNANRYSPKTTSRGPTASSALYTRSNRTLTRRKLNIPFHSIGVIFSFCRTSQSNETADD